MIVTDSVRGARPRGLDGDSVATGGDAVDEAAGADEALVDEDARVRRRRGDAEQAGLRLELQRVRVGLADLGVDRLADGLVTDEGHAHLVATRGDAQGLGGVGASPDGLLAADELDLGAGRVGGHADSRGQAAQHGHAVGDGGALDGGGGRRSARM